MASSIKLDLSLRCTNLLRTLNLHTFHETPSIPINIPSSIYDYANQADLSLSSIPDLLKELSLLATNQGLSYHVLSEFKEVALDVLARWLDIGDEQLTVQQWESRLVILAEMSDLRPDLWRYVA
jgi:hypothetical protein